MGVPWAPPPLDLGWTKVPPWISAGRWSIVVRDPLHLISWEPSQGSSPLTPLREALGLPVPRPMALDDLPFISGLVGALSYDLGYFLDRIRTPPPSRIAAQHTPPLMVGAYSSAALFDHVAGTWTVVATSWAPPGKRSRPPEMEISRWLDLLKAPPPSAEEPGEGQAEWIADLTRKEYLKKIEQVREHILAGDIYQANFTHRFVCAHPPPPWRVYEQLRRINPAPMSAYLNFPPVQVVSASPERLLSLTRGVLLSQPIKGTRRRGDDPSSDHSLALELSLAPKDHAELTMIVDLVRNDLGRVSRWGSVQPLTIGQVETFPTVFHRVASIQSTLRPGLDGLDAVAALFPGGSITGAPKLSAMEIINALEPVSRGIYTGSVGWFDIRGDLDLNITIRTLIFADGVASFHVGGGIVFDSDPEAEFEESLLKGRALARAVHLANTSSAEQPEPDPGDHR